MVNIPMLENVDWFAFAGGIMPLITYGLIILVLCVVGYFIFMMTGYPYKLTAIQLTGSLKEGFYGFGKVKKNRLKSSKDGTFWKRMHPMFNKKEDKPIDTKYILPGKRIFAYEIDGNYIPIKHELINNKEGKMTPVPADLRRWQSLAHKKIEKEYMSNDWWDQNKSFILAIVTVLICCVAAVVAVWLSYKMLTPNTQAMTGLADAINNAGVIKGM